MNLESTETHDVEDDRLRLIFTCCHPALPLAARVALTLRTVAGLQVAEISRAFLVSETTMAQRLTRARRKIEHAGIPYRVPPAEMLEERLNGVLAVLYLAFNAGYSDVTLAGLADSAVSLAESLVDLMPLESEARGLLALVLLQNSRRNARVSSSGELLTIEEQDRSLWNSADIERGRTALSVAASAVRTFYKRQSPNVMRWHHPPQQQTGRESSSCTTNCSRSRRLLSSRSIGRSRSGMRDGPEAGLALLDGVALELPGFHLMPAAQADLLRRAGRTDDAVARYREAIPLAPTPEERAQLQRRLDELVA